MPNGYNFSSFSFNQQLDEFIVEYVDGTLDPITKRAFEDYLTQNPELAEEVCHMKQLRNMMCGMGCGCVAPPGFQMRLRTKVYSEIAHEQEGDFLKRNVAIFTTLLLAITFLGSIYSTTPATESIMRSNSLGIENLRSSSTLNASIFPTHKPPLTSSAPVLSLANKITQKDTLQLMNSYPKKTATFQTFICPNASR